MGWALSHFYIPFFNETAFIMLKYIQVKIKDSLWSLVQENGSLAIEICVGI